MSQSQFIYLGLAALCALCLHGNSGAVAASGQYPDAAASSKSSTATPVYGKDGRISKAQPWVFEPAKSGQRAQKFSLSQKAGAAAFGKNKGNQVNIKSVTSEPWTPPPQSKDAMQVRLGEHMNLHGDVNSQTVTWKENHVFDDKSGTDMAFREQRHKVGAYAEVKDKNLSVSAGPEYTFDSERIEMGRVKNEQENSRLGLGLQLQLGF